MLTVAMLSAALDMRYDHHPPMRLSPMEPTRAERLAITAPFDSMGASACATTTGPIALRLITRVAASASNLERLRSGM
eukprot:CAMPEP_0174697224 /NCGR_PEP_ID=MMETSP1094-20130205/3147_1 /TAXON_ID=156173 /ORGANISM="Chrysochromulina brevifilum, Strain UTEX LB 985" /LENGTH=77 /DNA_ID=CAMNT_0015894157 /DNA_START=316 /DNA_END=546 /DNA_ORIENTATION=+